MTTMFGGRGIDRDPPLDALCYRRPSGPNENDPNNKRITTNVASCSIVTRHSDLTFNSNSYDQYELQTCLANPAGDSSQLYTGDPQRFPAHDDIDESHLEAEKINNGNHNDKTRLSKRQQFFSFFRRSNKKSISSIPKKRPWPFMTFASGQNIAMDSHSSNEDVQSAAEMNIRRRGSLFGILFSSRQKSSKFQVVKGGISSNVDNDSSSSPNTSNLPRAPTQVATSSHLTQGQTIFQEGASEIDEKDTGCLGCSNCEDSNRQRLNDEQSTCTSPVDSANDYLVALHDLIDQEDDINATSYETVKNANATNKAGRNVNTNINTITAEYGIVSVSEETQSAKGSNCPSTKYNYEKMASDTSKRLGKPLPKLESNENDIPTVENKQANVSNWQLRKAKRFQHSMSSNPATSSADDLTNFDEREHTNTASRSTGGRTHCSSNHGKNIVRNDEAAATDLRTSNVRRRRAMSEASVFKPLFAITKRSAESTPKLHQIDSNTPEELYPVDFDDVAMDLKPNLGTTRFYIDLPLNNPCDNKFDSVVEERNGHSSSGERKETRHLSVSNESINEECLPKEADQLASMDYTGLQNPRETAPKSDSITSPVLFRKGLASKLGKNMDKPKVREMSSPSKTRSRSGSLPVLFAQKENSTLHVEDQLAGFKKLGAIHVMDSDTDKSHERQRKRSVFGGPGKPADGQDNKSRNKARRSRTSVQENKVGQLNFSVLS